MNIQIYSREAMKELFQKGLPSKTAVISFYDPKKPRTPQGYKPLDYTGRCDRVFYVCVHDIDIEILEDYGLTFDTYLPEAADMARFIYRAEADGYDIICQCEYGQSRSAACAAAILEHFYKNGIGIFVDYRYYPNQLVFNKVLTALNTLKEQEKQAQLLK